MKPDQHPKPEGRSTWVDSARLVERFKGLPAIDADRFRRDVDGIFDEPAEPQAGSSPAR